ncbi:MAG: SDR family NAD(P)-dependent oxidoreductase, partial [Phycisphaeraceae bacterium]|nr:SDR family NAD(P)-dependent oxidoreductase [Phycisphaeraceae bacterium]
MGRLDGKNAIITGAAQGTGEVIARVFAEEGARVALGDLQDDRGKEIAAEIGETARFVHLDVRREEDWSKIAAETTEAFGGIDI